jgi:hypothetical protein
MAKIIFSLFFVAQANQKIRDLALDRQSTLKLNHSQLKRVVPPPNARKL